GPGHALKDHDHGKADDESKHAAEREAAHKAFETRWSGSVDWALLKPANMADPEHGTILKLGYRIDSLTVTMFLMVTFIATLIHRFSMGYMSEELAPVVEDHQVHTAHGHLHRRGRYGR